MIHTMELLGEMWQQLSRLHAQKNRSIGSKDRKVRGLSAIGKS
jgi:hypothetical protein